MSRTNATVRAPRSDMPVSRASVLNDFVRWLDHEGVPYATELEAKRLPRQPLPRSAVLPAYSMLEFAGSVARREGVEDLGVRAALHPLAPMPVSPEALRLATSTNGLALLRAMRDLIGVYSSHVRAWTYEAQSEVWFCMRGSTSATWPGAVEGEQYRVVSVVALLRSLLGGSWRPRAVHVECRGPVPASLAEFLAASVIRTEMDHEAIAIPRTLLERPLARPHANGAVPADPEAPQEVLGDLGSWTARLAAVLLPAVRGGHGGAAYAAEVLGMRPRTLQRRLRSVGLTCSDLLERARLHEARRLLSDPDIPIREVAHRVGYSSPSNFARAYRRYTGTSPSAHRAGGAAS